MGCHGSMTIPGIYPYKTYGSPMSYPDWTSNMASFEFYNLSRDYCVEQ